MADPLDKSAPSLIGDLVQNVTDLFRKEIQLLRAEMGEKATQAIVACGLILSGVVIALVALNVLTIALVAAIENLGIAPGWAALIVGVLYALIAFVLANKGLNDLKASRLAPEKTARALSRDAEMAKEKI